MPYIISATGGTVVNNANIVVRTGALKGSFSTREKQINVEPNTLSEVSGILDTRFDDVNYYNGGTGQY